MLKMTAYSVNILSTSMHRKILAYSNKVNYSISYNYNLLIWLIQYAETFFLPGLRFVDYLGNIKQR